MRQLAVYGNLGVNFAGSIFVGFGLGWLADDKLFSGRTTPWFSFIGLALGIVAAFHSLWVIIKMGRDERD